TLGAAAVLLAVTAFLVPPPRTEVFPQMGEGNLWIRAMLPPTILLAAGGSFPPPLPPGIRPLPEGTTVLSPHRRPDDGTDPTGFFNIDIFAPLTPFAQWPRGMTKERLIAQLKQAFEREFVGVGFNFSQTIQDNVEEAVSGVKGENSVKLFGPDLQVLSDTAHTIARQLSTVRGVSDRVET